MPPTVTASEPVTTAPGTLPGETDYHALNAMLNLYDAEGKIQFDKDVQAAHQYFREHVNQNTVFFHDVDEKLDYLIKENYYEREVLDQYSRNFVKTLLDRAYAKKFRFPTFLGAFKYYTSYTLKTFRLSYAKFGPTEIRILLAIGSLALLFRPVIHLFGRAYLLFDVGGVIAVGGMASILTLSAIRHTLQLYREERRQCE